MGSRPCAMAWRTTRFMWPSLTSVPEWQSSVHRMKLRGSRPCSVTALICAATSYQAEPSRSIARIPWRTRAMASPRACPRGRRPARPRHRPGTAAEVGRGVVPADRLAGALGGGDLGQHLRVAGDDAREVHHLAEADDARPGHRLGHVGRAELGAGVLQAGRGGHAGRHLHEDVDRLRQRLVVHQPHALEAEDVRHLVRVDEHAGGAVRHRRRGRTRLTVSMPLSTCMWPSQRPGTR